MLGYYLGRPRAATDITAWAAGRKLGSQPKRKLLAAIGG
jgi:hypothetical protein